MAFDPNNAGQPATANDFEQILQKYLPTGPKGGDPASPPATNPINIRFGNEQFTVNSPQEVQSVIDAQLARIANYVREREAELQAQTAQSTATPSPAPSQHVENDPVSFVERLVSDPKNALQEVLKGTDIDAKLQKIADFESRLERHQFAQVHPLYGNNPQIMTGLEKICKDQGLPVNSRNLELAAGWAQSVGYLPNENAIRAQQQQMFLQALSQQQGQVNSQGQGNVVQFPGSNPGVNPYMPPAPPPTTTGLAGSMPSASQMDQLAQMAGTMSKEDLRAILEKVPGAIL